MEPRGRGYFHEVVGSEDEVGEAGLPRDFAHAEESRGLSPAGARLGRQRGVLPEEDGELCGERAEEGGEEGAGHEIDLGEDQNHARVGELVRDRLLHREAARVLEVEGGRREVLWRHGRRRLRESRRCC